MRAYSRAAVSNRRRMTRALALRARCAFLVAGVAILLSVLAASPALAQAEVPAGNESDQIVMTGRLVITADETVDSAVIFNGPALVEGTVRQTLVVLNGDAEVSGTVREDVVVLNGDLVVRSGAEIGGDLVTRSTATVEDGATVRGTQKSVATEFKIDEVGFGGRVVWWVAYSVSILILGLLLLVFAPQLFASVRETARTRLGSSIGWGAGLFFLLPIGSVLLLVTLVGLPLGIFLLLALAFIYTLGYAVATIAAGNMIMRSSSSRFVVFLVGWVVLRVLALIPVVGGLLWLLGCIWGLGLLAVAIHRRPTSDAPATATPPMPPAPVGAA
jgi:cytoskeletal protein CcmA (bactofilin family)